MRRRERLERDHDNEIKAKAEELVNVQNKITTMERDYRRLQGRIDDDEHAYNQQIKHLEKDLSKKQVKHIFNEYNSRCQETLIWNLFTFFFFFYLPYNK